MWLSRLLLVGAMLLPAPAFADAAEIMPSADDCEVSASISPVSWPRGVTAFSGVTQPIDIEIEMSGRCEANLVVRDPRFELSSAGQLLPASVSTSSAPPPVGPLEVPLMGSGTVRLQWRPDDVTSMAGSYLASVPIAVEDRTTQKDLWSGFADLSIDVDAALEISPKGGMNALEVSLGNLRLPQSATVAFDVSSNSAFSISTSSASGGVLAHDIAGPEIGVPYKVTISSTGFSGGGNPARMDAGSGEVAIEIATSGMDSAMAGTYSDTLTVTFRSEM